MAYADLTTEQKESVDDFMAQLRPWCGEFARVHNHGAAAYTQYWATISAIMGELQDADEIPNKTGLAGAVGVTKAQVGTILAWIGDVATINSESNRQLMAKATGGVNLLG
jgi:hypothetical protein